MTTALAIRDLMLAGLEAACVALGCAEEPAIRYFQRRPDGASMISELESMASHCFE